MNLTPRQNDILKLMAQGYPRDEIAEKLGLSPFTVKSHAASIKRRLRARHEAHAVAIGIRTGVLS